MYLGEFSADTLGSFRVGQRCSRGAATSQSVQWERTHDVACADWRALRRRSRCLPIRDGCTLPVTEQTRKRQVTKRLHVVRLALATRLCASRGRFKMLIGVLRLYISRQYQSVCPLSACITQILSRRKSRVCRCTANVKDPQQDNPEGDRHFASPRLLDLSLGQLLRFSLSHLRAGLANGQ